MIFQKFVFPSFTLESASGSPLEAEMQARTIHHRKDAIEPGNHRDENLRILLHGSRGTDHLSDAELMKDAQRRAMARAKRTGKPMDDEDGCVPEIDEANEILLERHAN